MNRPRSLAIALTFLSLTILAGCATRGQHAGGYVRGDGPGEHPPANVASLPDAVPRIETPLSSTSKPYQVFGKEYIPTKPNRPYTKSGLATWYGKKFHGQRTASGERYDMYAMTAAHPTLPIPSYARVTRLSTGKSIVVRINDRGPFHSSRIIDLSYAAASKLGLTGSGSAKVTVQSITNRDIIDGNEVALAPEARSPKPPPTQLTHAAPTHAEAAADGRIYLQFGAFSAERNANHLARAINAQITDVESRSATVEPGTALYRVQIGPYPNRKSADRAAVRIQEATGSTATVTVR